MALGTFFYVPEKSGVLSHYGANHVPYDTVHDAADATSLTLLSDIALGDNYDALLNEHYAEILVSRFRINRLIITLDCLNLPNEAVPSSAKVFQTIPFHTELDEGHADVHIVEGAFSDIPVVADYGALLSEVTSGGLGEYPLEPNGLLRPKGIDLNATGLGWITKEGNTKLALRFSGDISKLEPVWAINDLICRHNFMAAGDGIYVRADCLDATNVEATSATLNGKLVGYIAPYIEVVYVGASSPTYPRFRFGYSEDYSYSNKTDWQTGIATTETFSANISGLEPLTTYHCRVEIEKAEGDAHTGLLAKSFTTLEAPVVAPLRINKAYALAREEL